MGRDRRYTEKVRNCQAFAADFFAFAAGKKGVEVFSSYLRPMYTQRTHLFLYDPDMYQRPRASRGSSLSMSTRSTAGPTRVGGT